MRQVLFPLWQGLRPVLLLSHPLVSPFILSL
jgi:hypothetical protein